MARHCAGIKTRIGCLTLRVWYPDRQLLRQADGNAHKHTHEEDGPKASELVERCISHPTTDIVIRANSTGHC
jgi:hypothetical protein